VLATERLVEQPLWVMLDRSMMWAARPLYVGSLRNAALPPRGVPGQLQK
jgi:hypothetical protein